MAKKLLALAFAVCLPWFQKPRCRSDRSRNQVDSVKRGIRWSSTTIADPFEFPFCAGRYDGGQSSGKVAGATAGSPLKVAFQRIPDTIFFPLVFFRLGG